MDLKAASGKHWDIVVVGAGMGGATFGWAMAKAGKSVLFLERGRNLLGDDRLAGEYAEMIARSRGRTLDEVLLSAGRWDIPLKDRSKKKGKVFIPFIGAGTGGSSSLYGAALERLFPEDFEPGRYHEAHDSSLPEKWPIGYSELRPWYREAEKLYGVSGELDPLRSGVLDSTRQPPPMDEVNQAVATHLSSKGLHPYRLPTACKEGGQCRECQGFLCSVFGKRDSASVCLKPAIDEYGATFVSECEVERIEADRERVTALVCCDPSGEHEVRGDLVVLAAGALHTPALLLRSSSPRWPDGLANGSGQVGRNLMRHAIDLYLVRPPLPVDRYRKQLAYNDNYLTQDGKLGSVQSFGMLPPLPMVLEEVERDAVHALPVLRLLFPLLRPVLSSALRRTLAGKAIFAGILEDLPYHENRLEPGKDGSLKLYYRLGADDRRRLSLLRKRIAADFKPWPISRLSQAENNQRIAHVCGTCRFGDDPSTSVLNAQNRTHDLENLYVVDASFFPSSGGINPALTIAANALRVAGAIVEQK